MELKHKLLCGSVALNVIWISTLIIDFDIQSWIPHISVQRMVSSFSMESQVNTTIVDYVTTEQFMHTTEDREAPTSVAAPESSNASIPSTVTPRVVVTSSSSPASLTPYATTSTATPQLQPTTVPSTSTSFVGVTTIAPIPSTPSSTHFYPASSPRPRKETLKKNSTVASDRGFLLNLPGCKMKYYKPFDKEVKPYYSKHLEQKCGSSFIFASGTELRIDKAEMAKKLKLNETDITCKAYEIIRKGEGKSDRQYSRKYVRDISSEGYNATQEFLQITCFKNSTVVYDDFFAFIQRKKAVEQRSNKLTNSTRENDHRKEKFSVVFIGIDSVSHRNFLRHFPQTYSELTTNYDLFEFNGYTKVGLNTFPCLLPLFTGKSEEELNPGKGPYDNLPFIWKNFSSLGYRTLFGEDWPNIAIFHYLKKGFYYPPMDYYLRPFYLAVEDSKMRKLAKKRCFNSRPEISVPIQWCQEFLTVFSDKPVFSFSFMSHLTHDYLNDAGYGDAPFLKFVQWFGNSAVRNNTFLILFSDHGIRWGGFRSTDMGAQEDSLPFFLLVAPPSFHKAYPLFHKNLKLNQDRLMTMYDVHEMLKDILNFTGKPRDVKPTFHQRGISLFDEIPIERTCDDAGIGPEYCVCHIRQHIRVNSSLSIGAAKKLVEAINNKTEAERKKCEVLVLRNVTSARHYTINKRSKRRELKTLDSFKLTVYTVPGEGLFEGVVLCELNSTSACTIRGEIDRINKYGNQSICIDNSVTKNYCYCSQNITKTS